MNYRTAIYSLIQQDTAIHDMVGDRIYPVTLGQSEFYPAIVYRMSFGTDNTKPGFGKVDKCTVEFNCISDNLDEADELAQLVREHMDGISKQTINGIHVRTMLFVQQDYEAYDDSQDLYGIAVRYTMVINRL